MSSESLTDTLCTKCGLCCNGVLFTSVICSTATEARHMEALGSPIEMKGGLASFRQPCNHLNGTCCSVYADRPSRCRQYECELLKHVRSGDQSSTAALKIIADTRAAADTLKGMLRDLGNTDEKVALSYRCDQVMDNPTNKTDEWWDTYARFNLHIRQLQSLLHQHFYEAVVEEEAG